MKQFFFLLRFVLTMLLITSTLGILYVTINENNSIKTQINSYLGFSRNVDVTFIKRSGTITKWQRRSRDTKIIMIINSKNHGMYTICVTGEQSEMSLIFMALDTGAKKVTFSAHPDIEKTHRAEITPEQISVDD